MDFSPQQVNQISKGDHEIAGFVQALLDQNRALTEQNRRLQEVVDTQAKQIKTLEKRVHELERQLGQNSNNSSKPPSSDGLRKPTNSRTPGGKKGAPKGHPGHTLRMTDHPDETILHSVCQCSHCAASLSDVQPLRVEKRQVMDLPPPRVITTEHQAEIKCCPSCGAIVQASFPERVNAPVQYGDGFAAWTGYFHAYHHLPLDRMAQLYEDLCGHRPSEATLLAQLKAMFQALAPTEKAIEDHVLQLPVLHADETGLRVEGKPYWMHTASDAQWTLLHIQESRGSKGMEAIGILPAYTGTVVHDCYAAYFKDLFPFQHALCNAHLLRECQGIAEHDGHQWASQMNLFLKEAWKTAKESRQAGIALAESVLEELSHRYDTILSNGENEWSRDVLREKTGPRGRKMKSKAGNLGERMKVQKSAILRFLHDAQIPFDNNQAERDIRMTKIKQKISGCFRTEAGAKWFARLRSVISTLLKQGKPVLSSLTSALRDQASLV